jgi:hypothetical protein
MATSYQKSHSTGRIGYQLLRYVDVVVVIVAAAPALILGAPTLGYVIGAITWIVQRVLQSFDVRFTGKLREPRAQLGASLFESFGRIWLLAIGIIVAGVAGSRPDGLTAAIVIFIAYSIAFALRVVTGPVPRRGVDVR